MSNREVVLKINLFFWVIVSLDSPEEDSIETESEAMLYREPTQYQHLLASLGSSNKVVADMNKRRYFYNAVCLYMPLIYVNW